MYDEQQLLKLYREFCSFNVNPPSFENWKKRRVDSNPLHDESSFIKADSPEAVKNKHYWFFH